MSLANIREQIKAILSGVDGAGVVHDYQRATAGDWGKFLNRFRDADRKINTWMITREKILQRRATVGEKEKCHLFALRKYRGLKDAEATELTLQAHLDDTMAAFDANETLNDTCLTINPDWGPMEGAIGLQVDVIEPRWFGNMLCNFAECHLGVIETVSD